MRLHKHCLVVVMSNKKDIRLNPQQLEAVQYREGPLLILAGAGSGKTGVVTQRIGFLLEQQIAKSHEICAVTFTNKAAKEMKERIQGISDKKKIRGLFVGTYHSLCLRILKENIEFLPLEKNFSIQGSDDQQMIALEVLSEFNIDTEELPAKNLLWQFSAAKNSGLSYKQIAKELDEEHGEPWGKLFTRYIEYLRNYNSVDFDDLILLTRDLLKNNEQVREHYQKKWRYFLADEFQDTNPLQFDLLKLLLSEPYNICAVGDDDQSIYSWRGADIRIILSFKNFFPNAKIIYLEQNYRSRQNILELANATIRNNPARHEKAVWSARGQGDAASVYYAIDSQDEAEYVSGELSYLHNTKKIPFSEMAILFRTNFQSRPFEEELVKRGLPYRLVGGYQFYDRKEVKDLLSYLRFIANHSDEKSLLRIINMPKRSIGDESVQRLKKFAMLEDKKIWEIIEEIESYPIKLNASTLSGILAFRDLIKKYASEFSAASSLSFSVLKLLEELDFEKEYIRQNQNEQVVYSKMRNLKELVEAVRFFEEERYKEGEDSVLYSFLHYVSLLTDNNENEENDKINLMTFHSAKGLEFEVVSLSGLMDGILPHKHSLEEQEEESAISPIEEERRLFYVGITRAKEKLFFTCALSGKSFQGELDYEPSRFLSELPETHLHFENSEETSKEKIEEGFDEMLKFLDSF